MSFDTLATEASIESTTRALESHNITVLRAKDGSEAREKILGLIPPGSEVMIMTSVTLDAIGVAEAINTGITYKSVRAMFADESVSADEKSRRGAAPEFVVGSVHAVTEDGELVIASNTGSQLAAYVYGARHVIFAISTKKIVKNREEAFTRVYEYSLPLESERAHKAYGVAASAVNKLLVIREEAAKDRITVVLIDEVLGF